MRRSFSRLLVEYEGPGTQMWRDWKCSPRDASVWRGNIIGSKTLHPSTNLVWKINFPLGLGFGLWKKGFRSHDNYDWSNPW